MNYSKFSIADVLTVLTALFFGFCCFLGSYFYTLGNTRQSILLSVIITLLLGGTALGAKLLKRTSRNFKSCFIWEMILLVLFTGLTILFAYSPFSHYFTVSAQKVEIKSKLTTSITQAENMFNDYEQYASNRETLYYNNLRSIAIAKGIKSKEYSDCGFVKNGISDDIQIENMMFTIHADLFPTNYSNTINNNGIKEVATNWLSDAKNKISGWKPIGIVHVMNEVEKSSNRWHNILIQLSTIRENCERTEDFSYKLTFDDINKYFTTLGKPNTLSISLALVAYLLMLLSYLITKRSTKTPIGKTKNKGDFDIDF